ncbi:hypothetical protein NIES2100_05580 [Calothrix sp. NIES-2100]|uniref:hypothetical protein n=1 Tax=Calothrix sp. NIES-2100 TaxID=1954172 RepID=UPI000B5DDE1F|nr:hypothetical protein NIES2100_05580 [Calothrix sp. NIES-2100]
MTSGFQIRKEIFDYLTANLNGIAEILPEHPSGNLSNFNLPKIVVSIIRDNASGRYISNEIKNPEIQITIYTQKELQLTKPNGILERVETLMNTFRTSTNFNKIKDFYLGYVQEVMSYCGYFVYRFY